MMLMTSGVRDTFDGSDMVAGSCRVGCSGLSESFNGSDDRIDGSEISVIVFTAVIGFAVVDEINK